MFIRKIYPTLESHLDNKLVTVITGLRRVGKSTALRYLMEKFPYTNKVYIDLERVENQNIFFTKLL